ncbi:hypothetical protein [Kushneria aurantia]|uniref:DUF3562 domain-containing protein n=1 Tax=Kushneria aurantia TaxID=504092 RepID=A0ABV6G560_9GAMM|nr:hypothetical protein [Kushneria aurantia]
MTLADIRGALDMMSPEGRRALEREALDLGVSAEHHFIDSFLSQTGRLQQQLYSLRSVPTRARLRAVK